MKYGLFLVAATLTAGCNSSSTKANNTLTNNTTVRIASATDNGTGTEITVSLTGGSNAGTYKVSSKESTCSIGLAGEKSFGNQYSETDKGEKELSSVQMIADDYDEAKKGNSNFNVQFGFGSLVNGASYSLNPSKNQGTGKLTITENGNAKIATVEGKTKEGVAINAVITCKTIQKMVDGQLKEE